VRLVNAISMLALEALVAMFEVRRQSMNEINVRRSTIICEETNNDQF
jgi:hypothetical protein